jgi:thioredoxin-like negative regulator of GroEL
MEIRLVIVAALLLLVVVVPRLARHWLGRRTRRTLATAAWNSGQAPAILAFSTPTCAECRLRQTPALEAVRATLGDTIEIVKVDALAQPEVASQFGVLTVPSSAVIDRGGRPVAVNHGFAPAERLIAQARQALTA